MANMTIGEAVDAAVARHSMLHPGSEVYAAEARLERRERGPDRYVVELRAEHFSVPLLHVVEVHA